MDAWNNWDPWKSLNNYTHNNEIRTWQHKQSSKAIHKLFNE